MILSTADTIGFIGVYYTLLGILVAYQMFALQAWLQIVQGLEDEVERARDETALWDLSRERLRKRIERVRRRYPLAQVLLVGAGVIWLSWLATTLVSKLGSVPLRLSLSPPIVLLAVYGVAGIGAYIAGRRSVRRALRVLG